ncbi:MAG: 5-(carboxyamino)imidazole ribonucleotide mutase [Christensenellales bacterium]|jgi:5-(carboxyamino)imidazole ribonucleotide mutase
MKVAVIMGSISDLPVLEKTISTLKSFEVTVDAHVLSAHRTPSEVEVYAVSAQDKGIEVIIAAAGKAAHLAGVIAAYTLLPVIGLPVMSSTLDGLDSLLSTVQMPPGVPVATVAINGAENAALLAIQILSLKYDSLKHKLAEYKNNMAQKIMEVDKNLQREI